MTHQHTRGGLRKRPQRLLQPAPCAHRPQQKAGRRPQRGAQLQQLPPRAWGAIFHLTANRNIYYLFKIMYFCECLHLVLGDIIYCCSYCCTQIEEKDALLIES